MIPPRPRSTLPLLCLFLFSSLVLNDDLLMIYAGGFKLSVFDLAFTAIVAVKLLRLGRPDAYALPAGPVAIVMAIQCLTLLYLAADCLPKPGIATADVARDLRIVLYFVSIPFLCYKDIDTSAAYATLQRAIVFSGIGVATLVMGEQAVGFSVAEPVRDAQVGIWVIPFSVVSIMMFSRQLRLRPLASSALTLYMVLALAMSLNRSQYLQLAVSVAIAALLGMRTGVLRRAVLLFVPAIAAGVVVLYAIGYMGVLEDRIFSVQDLQNDSSYGARIEEMNGQFDLFRQAPVFGHGAGLRSWVMGENGFELSTFAHNSWAFYLMKFGIVGTLVIMLAPALIVLLSLSRRYRHPELETHRRYLLSCLPIYIAVDSMSAGLAYAPKTAFLGVLLCYCLSLMNLARTAAPPAAAPALPMRLLRGASYRG